MAYLQTTTGENIIVDDGMLEELSRYNWSLHTGGYAHTNYKGKVIYMHRLVNNTPKGMQTDHINRNKLDNRKCNLRTCSNVQNMQNSKGNLGEVKYRGVTFDKRKNKYQARIKINKYHKHIGLFDTSWEAAVAYNIFARMYHGEFAVVNEVGDVEETSMNNKVSYKAKAKAFMQNNS